MLTVDSNPLVEGDLLVPVLKTLDVPHVARSTSFLLQSSQPNPSLYESQSGDSTPSNHPSSAIDPIQFFSVIDAFTQPKYAYNSITKTFQPASKPSIISAPKQKVSLFRERYEIILQRLLRNELFQSYPVHALPQHQTAGKISSINNLRGRRNQQFLLFGLLTRSPSGVISLSDPDATIALDLSEAVCAAGIFAPGIFVLVDGKYTDKNVFRVHTMVLPPSERREASKKVFGHIDFLGGREAGVKGGLVPVEQEYEKFLVKAERAAGSLRMIFLGEVNLDQPRVISLPLYFPFSNIQILKALKSMFEYYSNEDDSQLPLSFVLMGSFISTPFPANGYSTTYKAHWDSLAELLSQFPRLTSQCAFVIIPGPNDPWTTSPPCLPRKSIPEFFTTRLRRLCKDIRFVSNPCRLGYFSQELVIFRSDIADSLLRNRIVGSSTQPKPDAIDESTQAARELVKTILDQSHLTPFPLNVQPTYWAYDHVLRVYPLPTAVVMCDGSGWGEFKVTYEGCSVINTGRMLRVEAKEDGRARYSACWWEWDCGVREGREMVVGITAREERRPEKEKEKRERKKRVVEKNGLLQAAVTNRTDVREDERIPERNVEEDTQVMEMTISETRLEMHDESQMEDVEYENDD